MDCYQIMEWKEGVTYAAMHQVTGEEAGTKI